MRAHFAVRAITLERESDEGSRAPGFEQQYLRRVFVLRRGRDRTASGSERVRLSFKGLHLAGMTRSLPLAVL
jgi:hypothetical protein